jgi:hypothetical protein
MYNVKRSISYEPPDKPLEWYNPGDTADLSGWPEDDVKRFVAEGVIERIDAQPVVEVKTADTPRKRPPAQPSKESDNAV